MAEILPEKWMKGVAVTTICLAVLTVIAASRGTACGIKSQLLTAIESSKWAYYQAQSIKQSSAEVQKAFFEAASIGVTKTDQKAVHEEKLKTLAQEISQYEREKDRMKKEADDTAASNAFIAKKGGFFSAAVIFFQIGIMLSSVSLLAQKKFMWILGLAFGIAAVLFLAHGLFLQPLSL